MKKYAVNVTLFIEADDEVEADYIAGEAIDENRVLGWDLEEIKECWADENH